MESLLDIDLQIFYAINAGRDIPVLTDFLIFCRHKLFWIPLYLFILSYILTNYGRKKWLIVLFLGLTVLLTDAMSSQLIKKNTERLRPCNTEEVQAVSRIPCGQGYSFPSSHATNHFGIAMFLFLFFRYYNKRFLFFIWAGLVSLAQVYVGVHYPSDIVAGAIIGIVIGYISYRIFDSLAQLLYNQEKEINVI